MKKNIIALFVILLITTVSLHAQTYKIIVNKANPITTLTKKEATNYFLKIKTKWHTGIEIVPVDLVSKSAVRKDFSKEVLNKSVTQVRAFWQQAMFAGKNTPPREMSSDAAVIQFVKAHPGAIGYISSATATAEVKVIKVN